MAASFISSLARNVAYLHNADMSELPIDGCYQAIAAIKSIGRHIRRWH